MLRQTTLSFVILAGAVCGAAQTAPSPETLSQAAPRTTFTEFAEAANTYLRDSTGTQTLQSREVLTPESHKLTDTQLAEAARIYLRDSAEFPLEMQIGMVAISTSGRTIKKDHASGAYNFHGYNPRSAGSSAHGDLNGSLFHLHRFLSPAFGNSMLAPTLPSFFLKDLKDALNAYFLEMGDASANSQFLTARLSPRPGTCLEFKWSTKYAAPEELCGTGQFELQKNDLSLRHFSFDAGGLPVSTTLKAFGKCELRRYHAEVEFQKVTLPDDPKPFLVPKHVEVVIETDKGELDMATEYTPRK